MLTVTCTIKFPGGGAMTAKASGATPYDDVPVIYSGDTGSVPNLPEKCGVMVMRYLLKSAAADLRLEYEENFDGEFDAAE